MVTRLGIGRGSRPASTSDCPCGHTLSPEHAPEGVILLALVNILKG